MKIRNNKNGMVFCDSRVSSISNTIRAADESLKRDIGHQLAESALHSKISIYFQ